MKDGLVINPFPCACVERMWKLVAVLLRRQSDKGIGEVDNYNIMK